MAYLGKTPSQAVRSRYYFTASGGETSLSPSEVTGLSFTDANYVDVSLNGVALVSGTDYTATPSTNTISGLAALTASDVVEIVVYDTFSVFGGSVKGDFNIDGGNLTLGDNDKAIFGAGSDLQIYHDGTHSYISDATGTGNLYLQSSSYLVLETGNGNENYLVAQENGPVTLYYDSAAKLATTSSGIDVTGTVTADGLTVDSSTGITVNGPASADGKLNLVAYAGTQNAEARILAARGATSGTDSRLKFYTNNGTSLVQRVDIDDTGDISFYADNGTTQGLFWDASTQRLGLGTTSPGASLQVKGTLVPIISQSTSTGTGPNLLRFVDSAGTQLGYVGYGATNNNLYLVNASADPIIFYNGSEAARIDSSGRVGIGTTSPSQKFVVSDGGGYGFEFAPNNSSINQILSYDRTASVYRDYKVSANQIIFGYGQIGANEAMRIDSSGVVGIGLVPSGTAKLQVNGQIYASSDGSASAPAFAVNDGDTGMFRPANNNLAFTTGGTERVRIKDNGRVSVGLTGDIGPAIMQLDGGSGCALGIRAGSGTSGSFNQVLFANNGNTALIGSIQRINDASVQYNTTSDARLKENIADMTGAITRVKQLAPKRYSWVNEGLDAADQDGFLAHEAQTVVPMAVSGTQDKVDADGNPVYMQMDYSKLVPLLTGALQEAIAKIETLETQRADLEARLTALENAE